MEPQLFGVNLSELESVPQLRAGERQSVSQDADLEPRLRHLLKELFAPLASEHDVDLPNSSLEAFLEQVGEDDVQLQKLHGPDGHEYVLFLHYLGGNSGGFIVDLAASRVVAEILDGGIEYGPASGEPWPELVKA